MKTQLGLFVLLIYLTSPAVSRAEDLNSITIASSTLFRPFFLKTVVPYARERKLGVVIEDKGGSVGAEKCAIDRTCHLAFVAAKPSAEDAKKVIVTPFATAVKGVIASKDVSVSNLSSDQVRDIFTGKITNWKDVGGTDMPIHVWSRDHQRAVRGQFDKYFKVKSYPKDVLEVGPHLAVINRLKKATGTIAYDSVGPAKKDGGDEIKILKIDGADPTVENVRSGKYKFADDLYMLVNSDVAEDKHIKEVIDLMMNARAKEFPSLGFEIPR